MSDEQAENELRRRRFVKLSGAVGAAAILTAGCSGYGASLAEANQVDPCGSTDDKGKRDELWIKAQECEKDRKMGNPPSNGCMGTTSSYVVLNGASHPVKHNFLLVPTRRVKGIECPYIWSTNAPNYWKDAWDQAKKGGAGWVNYKPGTALGVNSANVRMQDQLHIHMAGLLSGVPRQLDQLTITGKPNDWANSVVSVKGLDMGKPDSRYYRALHVANLDQNLFALLRDNVPDAKANMLDQMMFVTSRSAGGFYILNSDPHLTGPVHGEGGTGTCDSLLVYD
jgi:CDP-diacylglycerol pyrophosphatase